MAKQKGIIKLEGTIGDITFLKTADGYIAKEKSGVPAERIANDPAFQRTRENGAEFGRAGKAVKILRTAFRSQIQNASDIKMTGRLMREMMKVVKADTTNVRGLRNVLDGEKEFLQGFDFNENGKLGATLYAPYTATIDRVSGNTSIVLPAFNPGQMVSAPAGTTHFKVKAAAAEVDFEGQVYVHAENETGMLPWDNAPTAAINLANALPAGSAHPLFLVLGIEFQQQVNGVYYPLFNGAFNALALVKVDDN